MEVTMFTWKCHQGHVRSDVAIGIDKEGDLWVSFICKVCGEEMMDAVKVSDMMLKAGHHCLNTDDLAWLKEMHVIQQEEQ